MECDPLKLKWLKMRNGSLDDRLNALRTKMIRGFLSRLDDSPKTSQSREMTSHKHK